MAWCYSLTFDPHGTFLRMCNVSLIPKEGSMEAWRAGAGKPDQSLGLGDPALLFCPVRCKFVFNAHAVSTSHENINSVHQVEYEFVPFSQ